MRQNEKFDNLKNHEMELFLGNHFVLSPHLSFLQLLVHSDWLHERD